MNEWSLVNGAILTTLTLCQPRPACTDLYTNANQFSIFESKELLVFYASLIKRPNKYIYYIKHVNFNVAAVSMCQTGETKPKTIDS